MQGDITLLVQSVNLICAKKVYCSNRPKYFFFASTAESQATFLKLVFDRVSKFGWMKYQFEFCVLKFKVVLSFFKSLNLSPHDSKSLENSYSITCRVRRKVIRKGLGNGNGLLFHMTQPISRSTIKAIACSKPTISEHQSK